MSVTGGRNGPDLEGLEGFIRDGDRNRARFFVGRTVPIRDINAACADAITRYRAGDGIAGATRLIQGAPGAGKTALLQHLKGQFGFRKEPPGFWRRLFPDAPDSPTALLVDRTALVNPQEVAIQIVECLDPARARTLRQNRSRTVSLQAGVPDAAVAPCGETVADAPIPPSFSELRKRLPPRIWNRPICLMVDEIQNLAVEEARTLEALHLGTAGLPIVPVLAGLSNAHDVLARYGISRLGDGCVHALGRLEAGQSATAVRQMLEFYRVDATEVETTNWAEWLESDSDGWPQHLQNGMRSLAEALIEANGLLAAVDRKSALERSRVRRIRGYRARRSVQMETALFLLAQIMARIPNAGLRRHEVSDIVRACSREGRGSGWSLPGGLSPEEFLEHLIHRGALQAGSDRRLGCPIPSFQRFLIHEGVSALADGTQSGQLGELLDDDSITFLDEAMQVLDAEDHDIPPSRFPVEVGMA